jgi:hypothetical protein
MTFNFSSYILCKKQSEQVQVFTKFPELYNQACDFSGFSWIQVFLWAYWAILGYFLDRCNLYWNGGGVGGGGLIRVKLFKEF